MNEFTRLEYIRRLKTLQRLRKGLPDQTDHKQMDESFIKQLAFFHTDRFEKQILELLEKTIVSV